MMVLVQPGAPVSAASVNVAVNPVEQLSLTVGAGTAASICTCVGLHVIVPIVPRVKVGAVTSLVKVIVCVCVPVLPQASTARQVLMIVLVQPGAPVSTASVNVAVNPVEQLSLTVGAGTAASICACVGLHVIVPIVPRVKVGAVTSLVKVIVCVCVPVLPQASTA